MNTLTTSSRKQTAFRLNEELLDRLRVTARKENKSLNNYVESALMDAVYRKPNKTTLNAIEDAINGKFAGTVNTSSIEAFLKSCE
jgi:hypothetical protein